MKALRALVIVPYFVLATFPLLWLALTSFKTYEDTISKTAKFLPGASSDPSGATFGASVDAYRNLSVPVAGTPHDFYVGSSRVDLQACKLEYSIVSPK